MMGAYFRNFMVLPYLYVKRQLKNCLKEHYLRNGKRAACNHGVIDARGRLLSTKEA